MDLERQRTTTTDGRTDGRDGGPRREFTQRKGDDDEDGRDVDVDVKVRGTTERRSW